MKYFLLFIYFRIPKLKKYAHFIERFVIFRILQNCKFTQNVGNGISGCLDFLGAYTQTHSDPSRSLMPSAFDYHIIPLAGYNHFLTTYCSTVPLSSSNDSPEYFFFLVLCRQVKIYVCECSHRVS